MAKIVVSFILILAIAGLSPAQASSSLQDILSEDLKQLTQAPVNFFRLARSPVSWEGAEWKTAGALAGTTLALMLFDGSTQDFFQANRSGVTENVSRLVKPLGEGSTTLPFLGGLYIYGLLDNNEKARQTALIATESFFVAGLFSEIVKFTFQRHRPSSGSSPFSFDGPGLPRKHQSFSSGHACVAFAVATVIAEQYSNYPFIRGTAYTLATLTALSRVHDNDHWVSDAFFGSALGYFTSRSIMKLHQGEENDNLRLTISPKNIKISISLLSF